MKVNDSVLIKTQRNNYIRRILKITPAGNYKVKDFIITKEGKVRGEYSAKATLISEEEAKKLRQKWDIRQRRRRAIKDIIYFDEWDDIPTEDVNTIYNILYKEQ